MAPVSNESGYRVQIICLYQYVVQRHAGGELTVLTGNVDERYQAPKHRCGRCRIAGSRNAMRLEPEICA
jgi:hypothetical protein